MEPVARLNEAPSKINQNIVDLVVKIIKQEEGIYLPIGLDEPEMRLFPATILDMNVSSTSPVFMADCSLQVEQDVVHIVVGYSRFDEPGVKHHIRNNHLNVLCIDVSSIAANKSECITALKKLLRSTGVKWQSVSMIGTFGSLFYQHQKSLILGQRASYRQGVAHINKIKLAKQQLDKQLAQLNAAVSAQQQLLDNRVKQQDILHQLLIEFQQLQSDVEELKLQKRHLVEAIENKASFIETLSEREARVASLEKSLVLAKKRYLAASKHLNIIAPLLREFGRKYGQPWPIEEDTVRILKKAGDSAILKSIFNH